MARRPTTSAKQTTTLTRAHIEAAQAKLPKSRHGHAFAPDPVPPGFHTIVDSDKHPKQPWRDLPPPSGFPPFRMSLDAILDKATVQGIKDAGKLVFHSVGDTGGVNTPTYIEAVTQCMENDLLLLQAPDRPSFFYHLGDVVYYDGESANYWPEFYEPYLNYNAPIVAIPGNHDGDVNPATGENSLAAFVRNFCAQSAVISPDNRDAPRRTMTQPNVYWTLNTPLVTIIGAYSNCPEGGQISDAQRQWLIGELKDADAALPIILAVHHPIYSAYGGHPGSTRLKEFLDEVCTDSGRAPAVVLTGHVHNYQRFAAPLAGTDDVPFIVAGSGGYNKRLHALSHQFDGARVPNPKSAVTFEGQPESLEGFDDTNHGYLRISVTRRDITIDYLAVPDPGAAAPKVVLKPADSVTIKLPQPAPARSR